MQLLLAQAANEPSGGVAGWALDLIDSIGAVGLFLLSALDSMTSILPVDLLLPLVGYSATQDGIPIAMAIVAATAGAVMGYLVMYTLGVRLGRDRARALLTKVPGIKAEAVDRAEAWFARHGTKAVLFGRVVPGVRCFISIPAGVERMPLPKYLAFSALGSLLWNSTLLLAGYLLGENWHRVTDVVGYLPYILVVVVVLLGVRYVIRRRGGRGTEQATAEAVRPPSNGRHSRRERDVSARTVDSPSGGGGRRRVRGLAAVIGRLPLVRGVGRRRQTAAPGVAESSPVARRGRRMRRVVAAIAGLVRARRVGRRKQETAAADADREQVEVTQP